VIHFEKRSGDCGPRSDETYTPEDPASFLSAPGVVAVGESGAPRCTTVRQLSPDRCRADTSIDCPSIRGTVHAEGTAVQKAIDKITARMAFTSTSNFPPGMCAGVYDTTTTRQ